MLKLRIYINNVFIFKISVAPDTTLRQLIAIISNRYQALVGGVTVPRIGDEILPMRLKNFYPIFNDEKGEKLFTGNHFKRSDLNACITKTRGLNLKNNDSIVVRNDKNLAKDYNLSFIFHASRIFKAYFDHQGIGEEEFLEAAKYGDVVTLEELLSLNLSHTKYALRKALFVATEYQQIDAVRLLLHAGAKDPWNDTLKLAIQRDYLKIVDLLLIHGAATLNVESRDEVSRVRRLVQSRLMLTYLLMNGFAPQNHYEQLFYVKYYIGNFFEAAMRDVYPFEIQKIIIQYALPEVVDPQFNIVEVMQSALASYLPLLKSLSSFTDKNDKKIIEQMFDGVDFSLPPKKLKQQLKMNMRKVVCVSNPALAETIQLILYTLGGNEVKKNNLPQFTAANITDEIIATGHQPENILEYCIEHYVVDVLKKYIHTIADISETSIVKALQNEMERSRAGIIDQETISEMLLKKKFGAITFAMKLRLRDQKLHAAIIHNDMDRVKDLLAEGATLNSSIYYDYGKTPVHLAIEHQHLSLLECLIEKNADLCIKNKNHQTPLELAYQKNDLKILTLLIQGGAYQIEFKSLHPIFVSHYVSQFFAYILDQVLPKNTPFDLIKEILQYVLDDKDFRNVDDFFRQVKNFHKKEFACTESFNTVLPPTLMRNFLFAARRGDRGDQINPCHSHAGGNRFP